MVYHNLLPLAPLPFQRGRRPGHVIAELAMGEREGLGDMSLFSFAPLNLGVAFILPGSPPKGPSSPLTCAPSYCSFFSPPGLLQGLRYSNLAKRGLT